MDGGTSGKPRSNDPLGELPRELPRELPGELSGELPGKLPGKLPGDLLGEVYEQLRAIARHRLASENPGHTLQATALVHEAYLKLQNNSSLFDLNRSQFVSLAADAMRRVLIDHARTRGRKKRGGGAKRAIGDVAELAIDDDPEEILALDEAICRLEQEDAQAARVLKLRFFAGLSVDETAEAIGVSPRTVKRDWQFARAWLFRALS